MLLYAAAEERGVQIGVQPTGGRHDRHMHTPSARADLCCISMLLLLGCELSQLIIAAALTSKKGCAGVCGCVLAGAKWEKGALV